MKLQKIKPMNSTQRVTRIILGLITTIVGAGIGPIGLILVVLGLGMLGNAVFSPKAK